MAPSGKTGRRPGNQPTRDTILAAARQMFAAHGYAGATIRGVAAAADVDAALVLHYFGNKSGLFEEATTLPPHFVDRLSGLLDTPVERLGDAIARAITTIDEDPDALTTWIALVRTGTSDPHGAAAIAGFLGRAIFGPIGAKLGGPDAPLRLTLVASQVLGLGLARHVIRLEPLASASVDEVAAAVGPTLQRYLTGPLD